MTLRIPNFFAIQTQLRFLSKYNSQIFCALLSFLITSFLKIVINNSYSFFENLTSRISFLFYKIFLSHFVSTFVVDRLIVLHYFYNFNRHMKIFINAYFSVVSLLFLCPFFKLFAFFPIHILIVLHFRILFLEFLLYLPFLHYPCYHL